MKIKTYYNDRVINLIYPSQYDLTSSLMRVQEFYESPIRALRDRVFTFEECFDAFNKRHGGESYFTKWNGFNVPGDVVRTFMREFDGFWDKELEWMEAVKELSGRRKFYLIGSHTGDKDHKRVVDHELAHAFYYINKGYRADMEELFHEWGHIGLREVSKVFKKDGYSTSVYRDEIQAYYSTSPLAELKRWKMANCISKELLNKYRKTFKGYKNKLIK